MSPLPFEESNDFSSSLSNEQVIASSESSVTFLYLCFYYTSVFFFEYSLLEYQLTIIRFSTPCLSQE